MICGYRLDDQIHQHVHAVHSQRLMAEFCSGNVKEGDRLTSVWNGYVLSCYAWRPRDAPRALVYISHGVTEYVGRYETLAQLLADSGLFVFGHDHVGHGRSEGERVHVEDVDSYVQDVIRHVEHMKGEYPHLPCILLGHSMGGLIAVHASIQRQDLFTGLVLSAAAVKPVIMGPVASAIVKFCAQSLAFVMPRVAMFPWSPRHISSIPEEVKCYEEDGLVHCGMMKPGWTTAMMASMQLAQQSLHRIALPLLVIHGARDSLVDPASSELVYNLVSSHDRTFLRFEGMHEVLRDVEQEKARQSVRDWILEHVQPLK